MVLMEPRFRYTHIPGRGFPHLFDAPYLSVPRGGFKPVHSWCAARFGPPGREARWIGNMIGATIWIRDDQDAAEFRIRWS
jgi:hypothetical protein